MRYAQASESRGAWVQYGILFFNLDELLKVEVDGEHVRLIRRDNRPLLDDPQSVPEGLRNLRLAMDQSANWVRVSADRKTNEEWYVNLDHVPQVLAIEMKGVQGVSLIFGPDDQKYLGVSPSNETSEKILSYLRLRLSH